MKKVLLIYLLLVFAMVCNAQRVKFYDLLYTANHDLGEVENHFAEKGYSYCGVDTVGVKRNHYSYNFTIRAIKPVNDLFVRKESVNGVFYKSSIYTASQNDYLLLKKEIQGKGYKRSQMHIDENGSIIYTYKNGVYKIEIGISKNKEYEFTEYNIVLVSTEGD